MKSVMQHNFARVEPVDTPRSTFDLTHGHKTTMDAADLVPVFLQEVIPGDTWNVDTKALVRMNTPIFPIMDNLYMDIHYFFCPMRLLWENWEKFMGEQETPGDSTDYTIPVISSLGANYTEGSIFDYFGLPLGINGIEHSALPLRMYNRVFNEWYRDENLMADVQENTSNGPDGSSIYTLKQRAKRHDYFTSCLPWPQKGDAVSLPLGTDAPITGLGKENQTFNTGPVNAYETDGTGTVSYANFTHVDGTSLGQNHYYVEEDPNNSGFINIRADLSAATAATVNELRTAFQVQRLLERDARVGTRYGEILRGHYGVTDPLYAILQRPEYLGGATERVNVTPIAQNSETGTTPQGTLAAIGTIAIKGGGFVKSFTEHGYIMGIASVRADLTYQEGIERFWNRSTRYDFYFPALAHLGEQTVLNKEIYADGTSADDEVFGYQERHAEYRYAKSRITGTFRSSAATPLDAWHLSQEFGSLPTLGETFITEDPPMSRVLAVGALEPNFIADFLFDAKATRPMPTYATPGLIDHF
jgi:hypothetical protein